MLLDGFFFGGGIRSGGRGWSVRTWLATGTPDSVYCVRGIGNISAKITLYSLTLIEYLDYSRLLPSLGDGGGGGGGARDGEGVKVQADLSG